MSPKKIKLKCENCHEEFFTGNRNRKYCSLKCFWESRRFEKIGCKCENCGKKFLRNNWLKKRFCSLSCSTSGKNNPNYDGKSFTQKTKNLLSVAATERYKDLRERKKTSVATKKAMQKISKKMSRIRREKFANDPEYRAMTLSKFERIGSLNTLPERVIRMRYDKYHVNYKFQYFVKDGGLNGRGLIADFYLPDTNTVVFVDGCYWHGCPICNKGKYRRWAYEKDKKITRKLIGLGYNVRRIWEHEIKKKYSISWRKEKQFIMVDNHNVDVYLKRAA